MNRTIILIGGAPTTGKSTIARELAAQLHLPWISTDQIRTVMRAATTPHACPDLYLPEGHDAEKFFASFTIDEIVEREIRQGELVWAGVRKLIDDTRYSWKEGFICEGVGVLPRLVSRDFGSDPTVTVLFVDDPDADHARQAIFSRGLWGKADTYPDDVKEKEVEWVRRYAKRLKTEAKQFNYPWLEIGKTKNDLTTVLEAVEARFSN